MEIGKLIIVILATYRIAHLLPEDDGPFFIFKRIRQYTMTKEVAENEEFGRWANLNEGIRCIYCMGLYSALLCVLLVMINNFYANLFLLIMAVAGGQSLLQTMGNK